MSTDIPLYFISNILFLVNDIGQVLRIFTIILTNFLDTCILVSRRWDDVYRPVVASSALPEQPVLWLPRSYMGEACDVQRRTIFGVYQGPDSKEKAH